MSNVSSLLEIVSTLAIVGSLIFAGVQVNLARRQRQRETAIQLMQSFRTPEIVAGITTLIDLPAGLSKADLQARYGDRLDNLLLLLLSIESVGILVQKREVPIELAEDFFFGPTITGWRKLERYILDLREELQVDTPLEYFQFLAEQMIRRQKRHPSAPAYVAYRDWRP
ncbi:MAG TPA: hypothetical protein VHT03_10685 [Rhizomicrobium sp.]|jgi:hypothetical protein|nr:hypothetical protein [Rhizomicrobium sp.]